MKHVFWLLSLLVLFLFSYGVNAVVENVSPTPFLGTETSTWVLEVMENSDSGSESLLENAYLLFMPGGEVKIVVDKQVEKADWHLDNQTLEIQPQNDNPWLQELRGTWLINQVGSRSLELVQEGNPQSKMKLKRVRP